MDNCGSRWGDRFSLWRKDQLTCQDVRERACPVVRGGGDRFSVSRERQLTISGCASVLDRAKGVTVSALAYGRQAFWQHFDATFTFPYREMRIDGGYLE